MRIYASKSKTVGNPWIVRQVESKHNHGLSQNGSTYAAFRKLNPDDFEFVCSILRKGETCSVVLKVRYIQCIFLLFYFLLLLCIFVYLLVEPFGLNKKKCMITLMLVVDI